MLQAEYAGVGFWILSLLFVTRPSRGLVVAWHLLALALSFAAPALTVLDPDRAELREVVMLTVLGLINGLLASAWCGRIDPPVSKLPALGITVAGLASMLFIVFAGASLTRLF